MGGERIDFLCAVPFEQFRGFHNRACRINHVINKYCSLPVYIPYYVLNCHHVLLRPPFVNNGDRSIQDFCRRPCPCSASCIRADNYNVLQLLAYYVFGKQRQYLHIVAWYVEESLYLGHVQVKCDEPVHSRCSYHVGHKLCRNRLPWLYLLVLPGIAVIRHHSSD